MTIYVCTCVDSIFTTAIHMEKWYIHTWLSCWCIPQMRIMCTVLCNAFAQQEWDEERVAACGFYHEGLLWASDLLAQASISMPDGYRWHLRFLSTQIRHFLASAILGSRQGTFNTTWKDTDPQNTTTSPKHSGDLSFKKTLSLKPTPTYIYIYIYPATS